MKVVYVYENWISDKPSLIGRLYIDVVRGAENYSFEYDRAWLSNPLAVTLDPHLSLYAGRQYPLDKNNFGIFLDSAPDRWGRTLMKRRERMLADMENRRPKTLMESDYLLGVYDETRMGALRFALNENGPFVSDDKATPTPPWIALRTLEEASIEFEKDEQGISNFWLGQLLKPGSSLGGARPKSNVVDPQGNLWIAKFPSKHDEDNVGAWELVAHNLAELCKLNVPDAKLETFSDLGSTFLVKRFDRVGSRRIHFASAMTMLGQSDGVGANDGVGYLDLVAFIKANGATPREDLIELWRRVVFNMAISNLDDHLRNHGFLLGQNGWRLSPLYDVNPMETGDALALNVSENDNSISIKLAIDVAKNFGIDKIDAESMAKYITDTVRENWERLAKQCGFGRADIEKKRPAFYACYDV